MKEFKNELKKNKSFNDFSIVNINHIMNKTYNKEHKEKIHNANIFNDKSSDNYKLNNNQFEKNRFIYSSKSIFFNKIKSVNNKERNSFYSNNTNFYCKNSIYSAPTMKQNRVEITRLLRSGKVKTLSYVNNIHNSIMIKESKLYRKKLKSFSKDNSLNEDERSKLKKKYSIIDMNDIKNIKFKLAPKFQKFSLKKNKRIFSSYESSLNRKKNLCLDYGKAKNLNLNDYSFSSNKTNYFSKYLSGKRSMKTIYEIDNNKINETNNITNSTKIFSACSTNNKIRNKNNKNYYYFLNKKSLLKNNTNLFLIKSDDKPENINQSMNCIYNDVEASKMSFELNDMLFNKKIKDQNLNLVQLEKKLITFKVLKSLQKNRLQLMSNQDINGLEKRILLLEKSIKKYNMISIDYFREINNYISFLKDKKYLLNSYLEDEKNKRYNLFIDIEKLVNDSIIKQKELEYLIEIRHFLIQVKNSIIKQPAYFQNNIIDSSRKKELGKLILGLKNIPLSQNMTKFLDSIPEIKNEEIQQPSSPPLLILSHSQSSRNNSPITKSFLKKRSKKYSQISSLKTKISENNDNKYLISEKILFDSPEEFIIILDNIESKNLRLIREKDYIKRNIKILKQEYDDLYRSNQFLEKFNDIKQKEEKLKKLKEENSLLSEKHCYLINNKSNERNNNIKTNDKNQSRGFYMDINIFKQISYYNMLENYEYKGLFFLEKLLYIIKDFFNLNYADYGINVAYRLVGKNTFNKLLDINKKNINKVNKDLINEYILDLLKIYENICEYIIYKDKKYNSDDSNKYIIHQKKEEINLQRKINNTNIIKKLSEEKRINGIERIAKRNNNPKIIYKFNYDDNIVLKNMLKKLKKLEEKGKNKNNSLEKEYNFYVSFEEDYD